MTMSIAMAAAIKFISFLLILCKGVSKLIKYILTFIKRKRQCLTGMIIFT